jgi:hypothetical protein
VLRVQVERAEREAEVSLFGDDGGLVAAWKQAGEEGGQVELTRSHDGAIALVVADGVITSVRLADGRLVAAGRTGRGSEASFPLDGRWTLEIAGELTADGGHTGHQGGGMGFFWAEEPPPDPAELEAELARFRAGFAAAASMPLRRRVALRRDTRTVVVHESFSAPVDGGEVLLWPPIAGPTGVLLRHAIATDDGRQHSDAPQPPWFIGLDGSVAQLPFELGVSPLLAMDGDRWLLPGADALWRDDCDEPLSILDARGGIEPLLVGGRPVPVSRILREAAPELLAALGPIDPDQDVPWGTVAARLDPAADELRLAIELDADEAGPTIVVASVPLSGASASRLVARFEQTPSSATAVAP